ncbi:DUF1190 domain-containing protein [Loktanella sp. SALINAS62]|uniref:DUF1190 domain-containing protein n=1 Tax=Loktanella sp. SALINAS62 TaxID=2706124 RepID=UPI001B8D3C8B|nr:DUF1190 domain-containing protein [Loktanella sp. SALINAS62]MBS1302587.1 DUF1190 domain-containing protein [Loktanella sp. SALINAS62]
MTAPHLSKRTRIMPAILLGASAFALTACEDDRVDANAFPDKESCVAAAREGLQAFSVADCETAFAEALVEYERSAPRYDDLALCEEQHGGECVAQQGAGGSSIFMPLMAGYLMGSLLSNSRAQTQPLYRDSAGKFATASGATVLNTNRGSGKMAAASFRAAPTTATAAPMSRATVNATGGFGSSRTGGFSSGRTTSGG